VITASRVGHRSAPHRRGRARARDARAPPRPREGRRALGPAPSRDEALVVAADGTWFRAPRGPRVDLARRKPLARNHARLGKERLERPGAPLASRALQDAAWPGERILHAAGAHRVRVAVSTVRKLGLADLLVTTAEGYALDADVPLVFV
jgi:hypothetical protein